MPGPYLLGTASRFRTTETDLGCHPALPRADPFHFYTHGWAGLIEMDKWVRANMHLFSGEGGEGSSDKQPRVPFRPLECAIRVVDVTSNIQNSSSTSSANPSPSQ